MRRLTPIVLAFGANLGDRVATLRAAQAELAAHPEIQEFRASPLRETIALTAAGPDPTAPRYLNGVASAVTTLTAEALLALAQQLELRHGRTRDVHWGDRTLDIDIVMFGGRVQRDPALTLPHPRAHERDFVLAPWLALDPDAALVRHGRIADLLARIGDTTEPYRGPDPWGGGATPPGPDRPADAPARDSGGEL